MAGVLLFLLLFLVLVVGTARSLHQQPFHKVKLARMLSAIQARQMVAIAVAIAVNITIMVVLRMDSCWTYALVWMGLLPPHVS